jgi:thioester reductase-like protein
MSKHLLLTGATGLVGQYLLRDFLSHRRPVAVVVRPTGEESARERVEMLVADWEEERGAALPRPVVLEGDITQPGLGLSERQRAWAARECGPVLHNAASLRLFGTDHAKEPWLSNFTGTAHVLDFCRRAGLRDFHHVSTAYVCGRRTGRVLETDLDQGQDFHNDYERCKCDAEKLVRNADWVDRLTVYRPGIIVGDSRTGYTATYHGLYLYFRWVWLFSKALPRDPDGRYHAPLRMNYHGTESCHIVPVDWVARVIARLVGRPECHGRTYHLTQRHPFTSREMEESLAECFHYYGPTFVGPGGVAKEEWNELEQAFYTMVTPYHQYWNPALDFDASNTLAAVPDLPCPRIDLPVVQRLIEFAIHDDWGKRKKKRPAKVS